MKRSVEIARKRAVEVDEDSDQVDRWLRDPCSALGYARPIDLIETEDGLKSDLAELAAIERIAAVISQLIR